LGNLVSTNKTKKQNHFNCIYRKNVIHFQNQLVPSPNTAKLHLAFNLQVFLKRRVARWWG